MSSCRITSEQYCIHDRCWKDWLEEEWAIEEKQKRNNLKEEGRNMEYVEIQDDGAYAKRSDGTWVLTPYGLAGWMDEEGGLSGLMHRNGPGTFIEAGCDPEITLAYVQATEAMEAELERIGAVL